MRNDRQPRFVAKPWAWRAGKVVSWGVYDRDRASWPSSTEELGRVKQDHRTEAVAQTEADRLNGKVSG